MNTIILTNPEASFYVEDATKLLEDSHINQYEILPKYVNFNFDPSLILAAPEAIYTTILIIKYGYDIIKKKFETRSIPNTPNIISVNVVNDNDTYKIETTSNNLTVKIKRKPEVIELSIDSSNE